MCKLMSLIIIFCIVGSNCASLFYIKHLTYDMELMRRIIQGALNALDYLHRNNVVHKQVDASSVYINSKGIINIIAFMCTSA